MSAQQAWTAPEGTEPTSPEAGSLGAPADSVQDEALRYLEQLALVNPSLANATLDAEVDALLGRAAITTPTKATTNEPIQLDEDDERIDNDVDFGWYGALLAGVPPLDDDKTAEAARAVEVGLLASERLERLDRSTATRRELSELYTLIEEGEAAWNWLILTNIRLVFHWSNGVARSIDPDWAQDAFQVGVLGLMRGLQGWDYSMGYRLSTFVSWHIRQQIQRWRANEVTLIRLPVHIWERLNREPDALPDDVVALVDRAQNVASFETMRDREEDEAWDGGLGEVEERADRDRLVAALLDGLTEQQADILRRRHGLGEGSPEPMTLEEIGVVYRVTRERIRQIEKKTINKLRANVLGLPLEETPKRGRKKKIASERLH